MDLKKEILKLDTLGKRLNYLRGSKPQQYYADLLKMSVPNYSKCENDLLDLGWKRLKVVADENDMTINDLLAGLNETSN